MVGLCLVAVLAMAAVAATSASALPEWGKCESKAGGKYSDLNCTKKAALGKGTFEWKKGKELKPVHFEGENLGSGGVLITQLRGCATGEPEILAGRVTRAKCKEIGKEIEFTEFHPKIECEHEVDSGEIAGTNTVKNVNVKFTGCKLFGSAPCSNGPVEGEIDVNPLKGLLGYISKPEHKVGLLLEPAIKHGEFAKFSCAGVITTVVGVGNKTEGAYYEPETTGGYDGLISSIAPVNTMTSAYTQVYTASEATWGNVPTKFEGKHIELLEDYLYSPEQPGQTEMWSRAGEEITAVNHSAEEGEIKG
jgi:hypothetical protein